MDDPEVDKKKAATAIARFVALHPHNIAQKTEVIVEHFRQSRAPARSAGRAKAMVVTRSRLHAVRYKQAVDALHRGAAATTTSRRWSPSPAPSTTSTGWTTPKPGMNGFGENQLPEKFGSDEYQLLIVADKYQTGFDQPLLHTMYVDKRLDGVQRRADALAPQPHLPRQGGHASSSTSSTRRRDPARRSSPTTRGHGSMSRPTRTCLYDLTGKLDA